MYENVYLDDTILYNISVHLHVTFLYLDLFFDIVNSYGCELFLFGLPGPLSRLELPTRLVEHVLLHEHETLVG